MIRMTREFRRISQHTGREERRARQEHVGPQHRLCARPLRSALRPGPFLTFPARGAQQGAAGAGGPAAGAPARYAHGLGAIVLVRCPGDAGLARRRCCTLRPRRRPAQGAAGATAGAAAGATAASKPSVPAPVRRAPRAPLDDGPWRCRCRNQCRREQQRSSGDTGRWRRSGVVRDSAGAHGLPPGHGSRRPAHARCVRGRTLPGSCALSPHPGCAGRSRARAPATPCPRRLVPQPHDDGIPLPPGECARPPQGHPAHSPGRSTWILAACRVGLELPQSCNRLAAQGTSLGSSTGRRGTGAVTSKARALTALPARRCPCPCPACSLP